MQNSKWIGLAAGLAALSFGCGDDEEAAPQTAFYFSMTAMPGQLCPLTGVRELPAGARDTAIRGIRADNGGVRLIDGGEDEVTCAVSDAGSGAYDIDLNITSGAIANFSARGRLTQDVEGGLSISIALGGTGGAFEQMDCTATAGYLGPGAAWISELSCPDLNDPRSGGSCLGTGALVFENCAR